MAGWRASIDQDPDYFSVASVASCVERSFFVVVVFCKEIRSLPVVEALEDCVKSREAAVGGEVEKRLTRRCLRRNEASDFA